MSTQGHADDFGVGKAVYEQLKDLAPERQERVLRWVAEGLGLSLFSRPVPAASPQLGPAPGPGPAVGGASSTDIKTFVAVKNPKSDNQFAATVAYFYRFEAPPTQRRNTIDGQTLQEAARLAGRKRLGNPRITLNNAKAAGYLDGAAPGEFAINSVGENLVAMTLPGGGDSGTSRSRKTKAKKGRRAR